MRIRKVVEETILWIVTIVTVGILTNILVNALVEAANKAGPR